MKFLTTGAVTVSIPPGMIAFIQPDRRTAGMYRRKRGDGRPEMGRRLSVGIGIYGRRAGDREYHEIVERRKNKLPKQYKTSPDPRIRALERRGTVCRGEDTTVYPHWKEK